MIKNKTKSLVVASSIALMAASSANALEFGSMGTYNMGMGNAGVAVTGSQYALYYNPALLGANNKARFALSTGFTAESNFVSSLDQNNTSANAKAHADMNIASQSALLFNIKGSDKRGAIGIGVFGSVFGGAKIDANATATVADATINGNGNFDGIVLVEVPIGYGHKFEVGSGEIDIGVTGKYIYGTSLAGDFNLAQDGLELGITQGLVSTNTWSVDVGMLYAINGFSLGVVGKYLNSPEIKLSNGGKVVIDPQVRAGFAYNKDFFTIAMDADVLKNKKINGNYEQFIGGGMILDWEWIDIRAGAKYDLLDKNAKGIIGTAGISLFGIDFAIESNFKTMEMAGMKVPTYIAARLGLGYSW